MRELDFVASSILPFDVIFDIFNFSSQSLHSLADFLDLLSELVLSFCFAVLLLFYLRNLVVINYEFSFFNFLLLD